MATIKLDEYEKLQRKVNHLKAASSEASGALKQVMKEIKEQFDCLSIEEAEALYSEMEAGVAKLREKFDKRSKDFKEKWKEKFDE